MSDRNITLVEVDYNIVFLNFCSTHSYMYIYIIINNRGLAYSTINYYELENTVVMKRRFDFVEIVGILLCTAA